VIISDGGILAVNVDSGSGQENLATGHDHRFSRVPAGNPWNRGPESLSWEYYKFLEIFSYYLKLFIWTIWEKVFYFNDKRDENMFRLFN
jgi:hypothetical protein